MDFTSLSNYMESLVFKAICDELADIYEDCDEEFFLDVACYALNRLPAKYIRYHLDMAFYLTSDESEELQSDVKKAVFAAAEYIYQRRKRA